MSNKINEVTESIKSKLSFDDYKPLAHNDGVMSKHSDIKTSKHPDGKKVKRTFYISQEVADQIDDRYAKNLTEKRKIDKSDIVTDALAMYFGK